MATPRKRDYSAENARRNERARAAGFTSYRQQRDARARAAGKPRDYALERERATIRATGAGFKDARQRARFNRSGKTMKRFMLDEFGFTEREFEGIRKNNLDYQFNWNDKVPFAVGQINSYDELLDAALDDWSYRRVGYIISFNSAVVDPRTNYDNIPKRWVKKAYKDKNGKWRGEMKRITSRSGKIVTKDNQFWYLVEFSGLMSIDEYESRYGMTAVQRARQLSLHNIHADG